MWNFQLTPGFLLDTKLSTHLTDKLPVSCVTGNLEFILVMIIQVLRICTVHDIYVHYMYY